jgi:hypothetical protein
MQMPVLVSRTDHLKTYQNYFSLSEADSSFSAILTIPVTSFFLYTIFEDIFRSLPLLVVVLLVSFPFSFSILQQKWNTLIQEHIPLQVPDYIHPIFLIRGLRLGVEKRVHQQI